MKFSDVAPIIEGKLHAWGLMTLEYPDVKIPSYESREGRTESPDTTSPQEAWAARFGQDLRDMAIIEQTLSKLSEDHQTLVRMRYREKAQWRQIAKAIHVSERQIHRERDSVIAIFAFAFGMTNQNDGVA